MHKRYLLLYSFIILVITSCNSKFVLWKADRPLKWGDFLASYSSGYEAHIDWRVRYNYRRQPVDDKYLMEFRVQNLFFPNLSWVKLGSESDELLKHEQLHFDICELYARKLYISFTKATYSSRYRAEIKKIASTNFNELRQSQNNYDAETNHSLNKTLQAEWERKIATLLAETPAYPYSENINWINNSQRAVTIR